MSKQITKVKKKFKNKAFLKDSNDLFNTIRITAKADKTITKLFIDMHADLVKSVKKLFSNKKYIEAVELLEIESIEENANPTNAEILAIANQFRASAQAAEARINSRFGSIIGDIINASYVNGAVAANNNVNIIQSKPAPTRFQLTPKDRRIIKTLKETDFSLIKTLTARHIAEARAIVVQGLHDGLSQKDIVLEMMNRLRNSEYNAHRIVRTEINRTANLGARARYLDSGVTLWQWNTALDERVCPTCAPLHGVSIKIGESFNPYMTVKGQRNIKHLLPQQVTMPPAHPFCRCGVSPSFTKTSLKQKPKEKVKKAKPKIEGYTKEQEKSLRKFLDVIPNQIKKSVNVLNGTYAIKKVKGRLVDDEEVQQLVSPAILNKYRASTGFYLGGKINKAFLAKGTGNKEALHEIGHGVYEQYIKLNGKLKKSWQDIHNMHLQTGDFITHRSSIRPSEHFADCLRFYLLNPMVLKLKYPEIYNYIQNKILLGNETESIITLEEGFMYKKYDGVWKKYDRIRL